ncbi:DUF992 domain-containing protein [Sinorhizobium meliloti]|uniref:DUF992 domain-containing protein n=1 Tax=Rhizobium meliloti TaxID=382 RepID=UPI001F28A3AB|nr:DUF992 domain-containing protein [Sinorhizobium meliloti]
MAASSLLSTMPDSKAVTHSKEALMIERFRNVLIRATVGGLTFSAIAVSGAMAEEAKGQAQAEFVKRGTLSCDIAAGIGLVVGSSKALTCVFEADGQKSPYKYSGTIDKLGLDIGVTAESRVVWSVYAKPKTKLKGALAGNYSGLSAEFAAGLGLGAKSLVGSKKEIALQPVKIDGQTGLNVAVGIASVKLTLVK